MTVRRVNYNIPGQNGQEYDATKEEKREPFSAAEVAGDFCPFCNLIICK